MKQDIILGPLNNKISSNFSYPLKLNKSSNETKKVLDYIALIIAPIFIEKSKSMLHLDYIIKNDLLKVTPDNKYFQDSLGQFIEEIHDILKFKSNLRVENIQRSLQKLNEVGKIVRGNEKKIIIPKKVHDQISFFDKDLKLLPKKQLELNSSFISFYKMIIKDLIKFSEFLPEEIQSIIKDNGSNLSSYDLFRLFYLIEQQSDLKKVIPTKYIILVLAHIGVINTMKGDNFDESTYFSVSLVNMSIIRKLDFNTKDSIVSEAIFGIKVTKQLAEKFANSKAKERLKQISNKQKQIFMGKLVLKFPEIFISGLNKYDILFEYLIELEIKENDYNNILEFLSKPGIILLSSEVLTSIIEENFNDLSNLVNFNPEILKQALNTLEKVKLIVLNQPLVVTNNSTIIKKKVVSIIDEKPKNEDYEKDLINIFGEEGYLELSNFNDIILENRKNILKIGELLTKREDRDYFCSNFKKLIDIFGSNIEEQLNNILSIISFFTEFGIKNNIIQDIILKELNHEYINELYELDFSNIYLSEGFKTSIILFSVNGDKNIIETFLNNSKNQNNLIVQKTNNELDEIIYGIVKSGSDEQINSLENIIDHMLNEINKRFSPSKFTSTNFSQTNENFKGTGTYCTKFKLYLNQLKNKSIKEMLSINWQNMLSNTDIKENQGINFIHQITTSHFNKSNYLIESLFYLGEIMEYVNKHDSNVGIDELIVGYYEIINEEIELANRKIRQILL